MKKMKYLMISLVAVLGASSCADFLEVEPKDRVTGDALLSSDGGINAYMAGHYYNLPMEDFRYQFNKGYNNGRPDGGWTNMSIGPEAVHPEWVDNAGWDSAFNHWEQLYKYVRSFCELKENIPLMKPSNPATIQQVTGEYHFMMAYTYFSLVRRYGGVPIITEVQKFEGNYDALKVPRSTEVATWKFVLEQCDLAAANLPDNDSQTRATKWAAYALKSRAALYAASVGKFWNKDAAGLTGEAVTEKLVGGFTDADIKFFYDECVKASAEVIASAVGGVRRPRLPDARPGGDVCRHRPAEPQGDLRREVPDGERRQRELFQLESHVQGRPRLQAL